MIEPQDKRPECPHCGERFDKLREGNIPTHDWPLACRQVCAGSGELPRRRDSALWKDKPEQREIDFVDQCRQELLIYGFAIVKSVGEMRGGGTGKMECPLCGSTVSYGIASSNGHCSAVCYRKGCINARE